MNWAWQYFEEENGGSWIQFSCPDCLVLEFAYHVYTISGDKKYKTEKIVQGVVDFDLMLMTLHEPNHRTQITIRRTKDNKRSRQNAHLRHDPQYKWDLQGDFSLNDVPSLKLVSCTDIEWMSINYRMHRAAKLSKSKRRVILILF